MPEVRRNTGPLAPGVGPAAPARPGSPGPAAETPAPAPPRPWQPRTGEARRQGDGFEVTAPATAGAGTLDALSGPVGPGAQNRREDVRRVQERLQQLGFQVTADGQLGPKTAGALKLFEAILGGKERVTGVGGTLKPGSELARALFSPEAPRWQQVPSGGAGWTNVDTDRHGWATSTLVGVLERAGKAYESEFLANNPGRDLIMSNDASRAQGGDTPDHESHETGIDLDLRLPSTDGKRTTTAARNYDREASLATIRAFAQQPGVERILIGDSRLLAELARSNEPWASKVQDGGAIHRDHIHVDVKAPVVPD
ncbi:MAG: peptidoglycan-binding domain-containing protein [Myxococcaceae bacterium]